jgi:hypothetical protein
MLWRLRSVCFLQGQDRVLHGQLFYLIGQLFQRNLSHILRIIILIFIIFAYVLNSNVITLMFLNSILVVFFALVNKKLEYVILH